MKYIVISIAGYLAAALITYSQEAAATEKVADGFVPPTLPIEMDIRSMKGFGTGPKKDTVTIIRISDDKAEYTIRDKDGVERTFATRELDEEARIKITGSKTPVIRPMPRINGPNKADAQTEAQKRYAAEMARIREITKGYADLSAKELLEKFKSNDPDMLLVMSKNNYNSNLDYYDGKDPQLAKRYKPASDLLRNIEIKDGDETFSLRPEVERLGMVAHQQVGDTCYQHAAFHLYQYQLRKNGMTSPSYERFIQMVGGGAGDPKAVMNLRIPSKTLRIYDLGLGGITKFELELVKHQLRNGHPCIIGVPHEKYPVHIVLAIGFETKNGRTTIEYQDSNRVWQDKGIKSIDASQVTIRNGLSAWYE